MSEQKSISGQNLPDGLPDKIVELLAMPKLTDLPSVPVGQIWQIVRTRLGQFVEIDLPDLVDQTSTADALGPDGLRDLLGQQAGESFLGGDIAKDGAIGAAVGLERLACLHFGIDDIRKLEV